MDATTLEVPPHIKVCITISLVGSIPLFVYSRDKYFNSLNKAWIHTDTYVRTLINKVKDKHAFELVDPTKIENEWHCSPLIVFGNRLLSNYINRRQPYVSKWGMFLVWEDNHYPNSVLTNFCRFKGIPELSNDIYYAIERDKRRIRKTKNKILRSDYVSEAIWNSTKEKYGWNQQHTILKVTQTIATLNKGNSLPEYLREATHYQENLSKVWVTNEPYPIA